MTPPRVALALLPATWLEEVFAGVWLTILEAGRWDVAIGAQVSRILEDERDMVLDLLDDVECQEAGRRDDVVDRVLTVTHGLEVARTAPAAAISAERAEQVIHASSTA